jgi:predicted enzyme related to lactoylglutathione lyase
MHGQFVWYELTTPDPEAAIKFYPRFTAWGTQAFDKDYTMWTQGGVPIGGIFRQTPEMKAQGIPPNWMPYVDVDDVDATAAKAKSLGATVIAGPDDIPGTGRFAVIQDPQGAVLGIYRSSRQSGGWDGKPVIGRFSWHELMTNDHVAAAKFYSALFGWQKVGEMDMGNGEMYYMFGLGGAYYGGMFTTPKEMAGMHPFWLVYINVKDVARAVEISTKNGAAVHRPQMDIPGGTIAILGDPQGAGYAVHQVIAPAAAPAAPAKSAPAKAAPAKAAPAKKTPVKAAAKTKTKTKAKAKSKAKAKTKSKAKAKTKSKSMAKSKAKAKAPARRKAKAPKRKAKAKK